MLNESFGHFIKVSLTVYIFTMLVWSIWSYLQFLDLANLNPNNEWLGSLCYLPHGSRVLMICFFKRYSIPALYLAEISGPALIYQAGYVEGWNYAAIGSIIAVIISVELVKWSRIAQNYSLFKPINFKNYKFLCLVVVISALLNGVFVNLIISMVDNSIIIDVITVFRFIIGDIAGASVLIIALWIIFTTLVDTRLVVSPDDE